MDWSGLLGSETVLSLAGSLAAGIWGAVKASEWWQSSRLARRRRAVDFLEAGVVSTYERYVREIKRARNDGRLTAAERRRARELALESATAMARKQGIELLDTLGRDHVDRLIERVIRRLKRR